MKLSTTTGLYQRSGNTNDLRDLNEVIRYLRKVGYEEIDLSFCFHNFPEYILRGDDWEKKVDEIGNTAAETGVFFYQCHLPFVPGCSVARCPDFKVSGHAEYFDEMTRRAYIACGKLGIKWAVSHPRTYPELNFEKKASMEENHRWQDQFVELGIKNGTGTAIENMLPSLDRKMAAKFCQHYDELIDYVDSFHDPMVGICWDTGHANQMQIEQGRALRAMGKRITTLHINDNHYGDRDEHLMPYMGDLDWKVIIDTLVEIGYEGNLNYETGKVTFYASGEIQEDLVKATYRNGLYLLKYYEDALAKKENASAGKS